MKRLGTVTVLVALGLRLVVQYGDAQTAVSSRPKLGARDVEEMMTTLSNWGRWGKDDQLGALNLITPQERKQAVAQVTEGVSVSLARDLANTFGNSSNSFVHKMTATGLDGKSTSAADAYSFEYHGYLLTHLDALCHLFHDGKMYNGVSQERVTENGAEKLGVLNMKGGLFARGVLMDMPRLWGVKYLEGSKAIYPEDLEAWEKKAGVKIESGDAIIIRTGSWARRTVESEQAVEQNFAGLHASCLPWLRKRDVAIVGSDLATDVFPSGIEGFILPVHWVLIRSMGTPILDNCDLEALSAATSARRRWTFLLTAAPLPVQGGTGSPINPIATF
jgi:kynurenine formamidase